MTEPAPERFPVAFVGAGPGAPDLITLRGAKRLDEADLVLYAGSLVNPALLERCRPDCRRVDSAGLDLGRQADLMEAAWREGKRCVRLHSGDPSLYGAVSEQFQELARRGVPYECVPGVTAAFAAAASLGVELTLPEQSQALVLARSPGRTPLPQGQEPARFAQTGATLAFYLSAGAFDTLCRELQEAGGLAPETPAAVVYRASWDDERLVRGTLRDIARRAREAGIFRQALLICGRALSPDRGHAASKLYDAGFSHGCRNSLADERFPGRCALLACSKSGLAKARELAQGLGEGRAEILAGPEPLAARAARAWPRFDGLVFVGAAGIAVRAIAPLLGDKAADPAVVAIDELGRFAVSLAGGHLAGANRLARRIARIAQGQACVSTATDVHGMTAFDEACAREDCRIVDADRIRALNQALLEGRDVAFRGDRAVYGRYWENSPCVHWQEPDAPGPDMPCVWWNCFDPAKAGPDDLAVTARRFILGAGCRKGCDPAGFVQAALAFLARHGIAESRVAGLASLDLKRDEPCMARLAEALHVPFWTYPARTLDGVPGARASAMVRERTGTGSVSEAAALVMAFEEGGRLHPAKLRVPKEAVQGSMTFALAAIPHGRSAASRPKALYSPLRGGLCVAGLGSGEPDSATPEAMRALRECTVLAGYSGYLDYARRLLGDAYAAKEIVSSGMRGETERCRKALERAREGERVCLVCSGDPGILAMAGLAFELREADPAFRDVPVTVVPGVTAASLAAAALGAPLQNGFTLLSLSDLLVPASEVRANIRAAASSALPCAIYNPAGRRRRELLAEALAVFRFARGDDAPAAWVRHAGQPAQEIWTGRLQDLDQDRIDMSTIVLVGGPRTVLAKGALVDRRGYGEKYGFGEGQGGRP